MSWMKRRTQPSPNPTNPGIRMYNPNQHSNQQPYQQWQQPVQFEYDPNNWYNQPKPPPKTTPPPQNFQQNPQNYWQQPYQQPFPQNQTIPNQPNQFEQYNQQNYYQNQSYDYQQYQQNYYPQPVQSNTPNATEAKESEDPWNWGWEDNNSNQQNQNTQNVTESFANDESWNWSVDEPNQKNQQKEVQPVENVDNQSEQLRHAAVTRVKNENLTPQWSIESQVSQDSSEDIVLTSESDNKSNILSRSSTLSHSPSQTASTLENADSNTQENEEVSRVKFESNLEAYEENAVQVIEQSMQELSLAFENKEIVTPETKEEVPKEVTPPPRPKEATPPRLPSDKNPYKRLPVRRPDDYPNSQNLVNLETLPDNSERPDLPDVKMIRNPVQWPENCEIAPINDRNQYLETGQLSDADVPVYDYENTQTENADSLPPPGLRRLVLGQLEQDPPNVSTDEPPPGLSRMVLGRTETEPNQQPTSEPPVGLHRMVPGESSSPESSFARYQPEVFQPFDNDSESELNVTVPVSRSATIGADTPPVNPQNTGYSSSSSEPIISRVGAVGIDSEPRDTDVDGANTLDESIPSASSLPPDNTRRDNIDGGNQNAQNDQVSDKRKTRGYATDSDEQSKERRSPRYEKDRRYYDDRRLKERESPDRYRRNERRDRRHDDKRYDEDTDYFSDKERNERRHRDEREEYDKRYSSLRREKDKRRRDYDERDRDRRSEYYYRYDDEYYRDSNRSRPSSRTDSVHDSYRERSHRHRDERDLDRSVRHRDRDREKDPRRTRDPYNPYYQGYQNYDPYNPYYQQYQQYQYYENLRRTNPQAYAEWYRKYYQSQGAAAGYNPEDRASVHSGRSSANGDLTKDRYPRHSYYSQQYPNYFREIENSSTVYTIDDSRLLDNTDSSLNLEDNAASQRLTPAKFSTAHVKASISSGFLLNILPHYPADGQPATVEVVSIQSLLADDGETRELDEFPGPLVRGITHKKTVIEYCENKIRKANNSIHDVESYVLMWELLILLLRQNGMVVGTDIAELLMKNRTESTRCHSESSINSHSDTEEKTQYSDEYITEKFREYLIYGSGKEALEWAMKHGLWGHALFLASKLDKRTYANVMMRFANGLTMNDPLQTLYQLLSGRQPAAVTCVFDEKWGDWRPHLAMILSNTTQRPELDRKAITTLGDTLFSRGSVYAAHFCYLMAQVEFGRHGTGAKLVLVGADQGKAFNCFAANEAIFMTEIYEYACSLSDASFAIPEFLTFKFLVATRMVDHGLLEKGLLYLERTADGIIQNPSRVQVSLVAKVCELSDRLKYCDPLQAEDLDSNRADATWLSNLKTILNDFNMGLISHQSLRNLTASETELSQDLQPVAEQEQQWQQPVENYYQPTEQQNVDYSQPISYQDMGSVSKQETEVQEYWNQPQPTWDEPIQQMVPEEQPQNYWNQPVEEQPQPQITMPNQSMKMFSELEDEKPVIKPSPVAKPKPAAQPAKQSSTGWFGGIWNKLSFRPNNQMKLPDDKNPTIVWDSEKKRWVNLEADGEEVNTELKPPPKMSEMSMNRNYMPSATSNSGSMSLPPAGNMVPNSGSMSLPPAVNMAPNSIPNSVPLQSNEPMSLPQPVAPTDNKDGGDAPKPPSQPNMFKLQRRGRNIKNAYVDVFNPGGVKASSENVPSAEEVFGAIPSVGAQMNYFVPAPVSDPNAPSDFLTPAPIATEDNAQQGAVAGGPMMYNPNEFSNTKRGRNH